MDEWGVLVVIITFIGFVITLIKPIASLTQSISKLTTIVERLEQDVRTQEAQAITSHQKLWDYNKGQDEKIQDHEVRIGILESTME